MIPKKIHYTWFSNEAFPQEIQKCINSWKEILIDYEFVLWDKNKIKTIKNVFLNEALSEKKWAFASDFVRLYAVYTEGGIYLDTDVLLFKKFDELLSHSCFIGRENSFHLVDKEVVNFLSSHCFGACKHNSYIKDCLDYYQDRHFIQSTNTKLPNVLRLDLTLLPYIQAVIAKEKKWNWQIVENIIYQCTDFTVFPKNFFDASTHDDTAFCTHLAFGSWRESRIVQEKITLKYKIKWRIVKLFEFILKKLGYIIVRYK